MSSNPRQTSGWPSTRLTHLVSILLLIVAPCLPVVLFLHDQLNLVEDSGALALPAFQHQPQLPVYLTCYGAHDHWHVGDVSRTPRVQAIRSFTNASAAEGSH